MPRHWLFPAKRLTESTARAVAVTGAGGSIDPVDGDRGYTRVGAGRREIPAWTREKARTFSVAAYRSNPMARAVVDTYVSFAVGDSGVSVLCTNPQVRQVVDAWWTDPKNRLTELQPLMMRDWMLMGEAAYEYMVGPSSGVVRWSPIDPTDITDVELDRGNPLWPKNLVLRHHDQVTGEPTRLPIVTINDLTSLRDGRVGFFPSWRALLTDRRGYPFLGPILDDLDAYGQVLSNLIDRTALARYLVWDVTVNGGSAEIDNFIKARGGTHIPPSGTLEIHNESVKWEPKTANTGSFEDTNTMMSILTNVAGGAGLAKTWLAESDGANRATSLSMAEPVRRRVGAVQKEWLAILTEMARFAVDQAVAAGRLPKLIDTTNVAGETVQVPAADLVHVNGPEIAAADSQVTAAVMINLSQALEKMVDSGVLTQDAAALAAQKAWEQFVGQPFRPDLAKKVAADPAGSADAVAEAVAATDHRPSPYPPPSGRPSPPPADTGTEPSTGGTH